MMAKAKRGATVWFVQARCRADDEWNTAAWTACEQQRGAISLWNEEWGLLGTFYKLRREKRARCVKVQVPED